MRALWIESGDVAFRADLPEPEHAPEEVRVQVLRAGVCATDLALARGYMGFRGVPGHEFVGRALEGSLRDRRVVGEINAGCGECPRCESGVERHCPTRTVLGILERPGAFADRLSLPERNLHAVPDGVSDEEAVFVEPLAAAFEITEQVDLSRFSNALILGDGRLGCLCAQVLVDQGLTVDLVGRHPEHAEWLPGGVRHLGPDAGPSSTRPGARYELVIEATGDARVFQTALGLTEPRGTLVLKTTSEAPAPIDLAPLVVDEVHVVGSRCGPFAPALEALAERRIDVAPLLHATYPLEEGAHAFEHAARPGTLKVQLEVDA